jgi:hypothetical protein
MTLCPTCGADPCANPSFCSTCRPQSDEAEIDRLAKLSVLEYEHEREAAAERVGARTSILDKLVTAKRTDTDNGKQGRALSLPEPEPSPEPVDGAALLGSMSSAIRRYVMLPDHVAIAAALWALHTYLLDAIYITPRLAITSPEKQCGKTTLLDVLARLVWRPLPAANATAAALFRTVEKVRPTLLVDEADTFLPDNEEVRGILNSGHRRGGSVLRIVGDDHEPQQFSTYSACAIALIGQLPGTLADRSIEIALRRRRPDEPVEPLRAGRTGELDALARQARRWAADHVERVSAADPLMPAGIINRVADNWRPLLAIAGEAGAEWPKRAREALAAIQATVEDESKRIWLLADIRAIFGERGVDRLASEKLVEALVAIEGQPWAEWNKGRSLTTNGLARLLKPFVIKPATIRIGDETAKGYYLTQFVEAFERYLDPQGGLQPSHRHNIDGMGTSETFQPSQRAAVDRLVTDEKCKKSNNGGVCDGVTVGNPDSPGKANGSGAERRCSATGERCDHCGQSATPAEPLQPWDWPGRPDGIWLHRRCEGPRFDSEGPPDDQPSQGADTQVIDADTPERASAASTRRAAERGPSYGGEPEAAPARRNIPGRPNFPCP